MSSCDSLVKLLRKLGRTVTAEDIVEMEFQHAGVVERNSVLYNISYLASKGYLEKVDESGKLILSKLCVSLFSTQFVFEPITVLAQFKKSKLRLHYFEDISEILSPNNTSEEYQKLIRKVLNFLIVPHDLIEVDTETQGYRLTSHGRRWIQNYKDKLDECVDTVLAAKKAKLLHEESLALSEESIVLEEEQELLARKEKLDKKKEDIAMLKDEVNALEAKLSDMEIKEKDRKEHLTQKMKQLEDEQAKRDAGQSYTK